ncbi:synapsin-1-like [Poeciliopsis prolifica]|uniref:synapsin-1-like n=1 Tax=Poeciliopsis prolifica TaxID=188132 RepID=UPI0024140284|nr:synapsin-1-like [Poeciliopsis prolifica]
MRSCVRAGSRVNNPMILRQGHVVRKMRRMKSLRSSPNRRRRRGGAERRGRRGAQRGARGPNRGPGPHPLPPNQQEPNPEPSRSAAGPAAPSGSRTPGKAGCPGLREQRGPGPHGRPDGRPAVQSHKAFTVIPPNPKKRREIQKKAEAELAALEELRLSRAMAYVSINPSSVGETPERLAGGEEAADGGNACPDQVTALSASYWLQLVAQLLLNTRQRFPSIS